MPLVLSQNDITESGITYDDHTGVSYEYPNMYRRVIQPGLRFVYYRGRKRAKGRQTPIYFGTGIIGAIDFKLRPNGRLRCEILDYEPFESPVPFKRGNRDYFERGAVRTGYFQQGVRRISERELEAILRAAKGNESSMIIPALKSSNAKAGTLPQHHSAEQLRRNTIRRMANTAWATVRAANGQKVARTVKDKELLVSKEDLEEHLETLLKRQDGRCALTGIRLEIDGSPQSDLYCSLDRIDSSGHYARDNLQIVCRFANRWKGSDDDTKFRKLIELIRSVAGDPD